MAANNRMTTTDPPPPVAPPPILISGEAGSDMNFGPVLPGTAGHLYGALEEDLWYSIEMYGLPDEEALDRANRNIQAILDGDDSLRQYMDDVLDAFSVWLQIDENFGPGWLVETCYHTRKEWLRYLGEDEEEAEESAREVSQRMADGQAFRANDPRNSAIGPRPLGGRRTEG